MKSKYKSHVDQSKPSYSGIFMPQIAAKHHQIRKFPKKWMDDMKMSRDVCLLASCCGYDCFSISSPNSSNSQIFGSGDYVFSSFNISSDPSCPNCLLAMSQYGAIPNGDPNTLVGWDQYCLCVDSCMNVYIYWIAGDSSKNSDSYGSVAGSFQIDTVDGYIKMTASYTPWGGATEYNGCNSPYSVGPC